MRLRWAEGHIELLIEIIKKHELIWNTKHSKYSKNPKIRQKHWQDVLKIFYDSLKKKTYQPQDVQAKWHALRWQFQVQCQRYSVQGFCKKRWRYYDMLTFLTGHWMSKRQRAVVDRKKYYLRAKVAQSMLEETDEDSDAVAMSPQSTTADDKEANNNHTLPTELALSDPTKKESDDDSYVSIGSISPRFYQDDGRETSTSETMSTDCPKASVGEMKRFEADVASVCDVDFILQVDLNT